MLFFFWDWHLINLALSVVSGFEKHGEVTVSRSCLKGIHSHRRQVDLLTFDLTFGIFGILT